jgi:hypothetical protein
VTPAAKPLPEQREEPRKAGQRVAPDRSGASPTDVTGQWSRGGPFLSTQGAPSDPVPAQAGICPASTVAHDMRPLKMKLGKDWRVVEFDEE